MLLQPRTQPKARGATTRVSLPVAVVAGSLLLGLLSLVLPSTPTYDPFAWIIWGREITQLDLNTVDGPSWKPLPVIVTTLTAPLGEASPFLWVAVARAGAIAAVVVCGMLAARLAGPAAGTAAAIGLAVMPWHLRNGALGNSEGLMVAFVLGLVLAHLHGRRGWAFAFAVGAGLLRPEAWPFLGLYAVWLLVEDRGRLPWLAGGLATLPVLWLGPELWGSGNAFRASDRAQLPNRNSPAFADQPAVEVVANALELVPVAVLVGASLAAALALAGRVRASHERATALALAVLAVAWIGLVAVMTSWGFSGNTRYLLVPAAILVLLGAVGVVWLVRPVLERAGAAARPLTAVVALGAAALFTLPVTDQLRPTLRGVAYQSDLYADLGRVIRDAGGREQLAACGHPYTGPFLVPQVAWRLGVHTSDVDLEPVSPRVVFHVRTIEGAPLMPAPSTGGRTVLARRGGWRVTADCGGRR